MSDASYAIAKREGVSDSFGYQTQLQFYKAGRDKVKGAWIGINKNTGEIEVFQAENKPWLITDAFEKVSVVKASTVDSLPPRPYELETEKKTGRTKLCFQCKFCDHRENCWNILGEEPGYNNSITILATEKGD